MIVEYLLPKENFFAYKKTMDIGKDEKN